MDLFYIKEQYNIGDEGSLDQQESKHCIKVLRLKSGDSIYLIDGVGGFYKAEIVDIGNKNCTYKVLEVQKEYKKRDYTVHMAVAPTKNINRFEWFIEKATEIGIDEITPIVCQYSERNKINIERLNKILVSAMKQSYKAYLPKLNDAIKFSDFIKKEIAGEKYIAHCYDEKKKHLKELYQKNQNALLLIGPEGDFSKEEVEQALKSDYIPVNLGDNRLRTETAAVVGCSVINLINE